MENANVVSFHGGLITRSKDNAKIRKEECHESTQISNASLAIAASPYGLTLRLADKRFSSKTLTLLVLVLAYAVVRHYRPARH